jgi:hypothetical protein
MTMTFILGALLAVLMSTRIIYIKEGQDVARIRRFYRSISKMQQNTGKVTYLGTAVTNKNYVSDEIKSRFNSSVQCLLPTIPEFLLLCLSLSAVLS